MNEYAQDSQQIESEKHSRDRVGVRRLPLEGHRRAVCADGRPDVERGEHRRAQDEQRRLGEETAGAHAVWRNGGGGGGGEGRLVSVRRCDDIITAAAAYRRPKPNITSEGSRPSTSRFPAESRKRSGMKFSGSG